MPALLPDQTAAVRRNEASLWRAALEFAPWDETARRHALQVPADFPHAYADYLAAEAAAGRLLTVAYTVDGERKGSAFVRVDNEGGRKIAFVVGGAADADAPHGLPWLQCLPVLEDACRRMGCDLIRTATARPGVARAYRARGWGISEVTLTKSLHG